jgi:SAM-dependent methyltransferase
MMKKWYSEFGDYTIEEYIERFLANPDEIERLYCAVSLVPHDTTTLLDVGCGLGIFLDLLYKKRKIKGIGIDISEVKVNFCKKQGILAEVGDAGNLKFNDLSFDVVTALEVLEHLPYGTYERALKEIARCARKAIIISVPYNEKRRFVRCPYCYTIFNPSYHLRVFKEDTLLSLFPGFKLKKIIRIGSIQRIPILLDYIRRVPALSEKFSSKPVEFVCPVCGFSKPPSKKKEKPQSFWIKLINVLLQFFPRCKQPRWIIALYERTKTP